MIGKWHRDRILGRRQRAISEAMLGLIKGEVGETAVSVLDVGCGNGLISKLVRDGLADGSSVVGVETAVRGGEFVEVTAFDGQHLGFKDGSFDVVLLCDVLHHVPSFREQAKLLSECARVSRAGVCVKDHTEIWLSDGIILSAMDWVGNFSYGIPLPCTYLNPQQWDAVCGEAKLSRGPRLDSPLGLHPGWISWLTEKTPWGSNLHFVEFFRKIGETSGRA